MLLESNAPEIPSDLRGFLRYIGALKDGKRVAIKTASSVVASYNCNL